MKVICFVLLTILLASCGENQPEKLNAPSEKPEKPSQDSIASKGPKQYNDKEESVTVNDTTFIVREISKNYYHTIYIDKTQEAEYKKSVSKAKITKQLQQQINEDLLAIKDREKPVDFKLPQFWLPLEKYKDQYYLYQPCDGIFEYQYLVTKEVVAHLFYDGPSISVIKSAERINTRHYRFEFYGSNGLKELDIFIIDPIKKIAVFRFSDAGQTWYELFTSSSSAANFDVIVNDCKTQKESEFNFEKVNFEALIEKFN